MFIQFAYDEQSELSISDPKLTIPTNTTLGIPNSIYNPFVNIEFTKIQKIFLGTSLFVFLFLTLILLGLLWNKVYKKIQSSRVPGYCSNHNYIPPNFSDSPLVSSHYSPSVSLSPDSSCHCRFDDTKPGHTYRNCSLTPIVPMTINPVYEMIEKARKYHGPGSSLASQISSLDDDNISHESSDTPLIAKKFPLKLGTSIPLRIRTDLDTDIINGDLSHSSVSPTSYLEFLLEDYDHESERKTFSQNPVFSKV